jgi:hypothetical protein
LTLRSPSTPAPLLKLANEEDSRPPCGLAGGGELVGGLAGDGESASPTKLDANAAADVMSSARTVDVFDPHDHLSDSVGKPGDGRGHATADDALQCRR